MAYMQVWGPCVTCGAFICFNPIKVPSTSAITGEREPVCRSCMAEINKRRELKGEKPIEIAVDAYEAAECD